VTRTARTLFALAIILAFITTFTGFSFASQITKQIDESSLVGLARNTHPAANAQNDRGPVSDSFDADHMLLILQRSPAQERKVNKFIDSLNDRNSPNFHKWLTAEEFGERFGVAQDDLDKITGWLEYHGFRVNQVYANRMMIDFSGTAGQLREAFHTSIHNLEVNGEQHVANMNDPQIPAALAPVVRGITSLHDFKPEPMYRVRPDYTFAGCTGTTGPGSCYAVTPQDDAVIYNLNPLWAAGYSGQGQTIAVVEDTDTYGGAADWNSFRTAFGLSSYSATYSQVHPGSCVDPGTNADDGEAALDVEMATAFAPSAAIELISCPSTTFTFGGIIALANLVNGSGPYPQIVSQSYGACETETGDGGTATFNNVFQTAAAEGTSVFVSTGDAGATACAPNIASGTQYARTPLSVTGWGETPYNVAVGGTDFEDTYNAKLGYPSTTPISTYWNSSNTSTYESAKSYIPEIPWNDSCASELISDYVLGTWNPYAATPGMCNNSSYDTSATYLTTGAASGGASNCAMGVGGSNESNYLISGPTCQGYPKPSWQSAYGVPTDGVRDIPDVSLFASNGVWGHYQVVCWSDPSQTAGGAVSCSGAPNTWSGFGGTSVATPAMSGIQALINQYTGEKWGNPNPIYYQIAQSEYGTQGGTFLGSSCNSSGSGGPASSCVFYDVTQGDIDVPCRYDGTVSEAHCYKPSTNGVASTDVITATTVLWGGSGYTTAPTCTIAGPSNASPYKEPNGTVLYAGGTQATCTATVNSGTTTAVWTIPFSSTYASYYAGLSVCVQGAWDAGNYCYTLSGTSNTTVATNLCTSIGSSNPYATCSASSGTATLTAKTAGAAGNFQVNYGPQLGGPDINEVLVMPITNTTKGQGPNYVSGITINSGGSGYGPETPITFGGPGTGAVAVANTSPATASSSYQPAYGAAPGYDLATGLGSVNAKNLVCSSVWGAGSGAPCVIPTTTAVTSSLNPSVYGQSVTFTAAVTPSAATGSVTFTIDGVSGSPITLSSGSATYSTSSLTVGTHTVSATYGGGGIYTGSTGTLSPVQTVNSATAGVGVVCTPDPSNYNQSVTCTATISGQYGLVKGRTKPMIVTGTVTWSSNTGCGTTPVTSGTPGTATCTTSALATGTDTIQANYSGDSNHQAGSGTASQVVNPLATSTAVGSTLNPSAYGQAVSFTANVTGTGTPTGAVQFYVDSILFDTETLASGTATSVSTSTLAVGTHTVTATYLGDTNDSGSTGTLSGGQVVGNAPTTTSVIGSPNPSVYATPVTFTATINAANGLVRRNSKGKPLDVTGTVTWSTNTGCGTTTVTPTTGTGVGTATCTTSRASSLPVGTDVVTATYNGDSNHSGSTGSENQVVTGGIATTIDVTNVSPASEDYASTAPVTITAVLSWVGNGVAPTASDVTISGNGAGTYGATSCAARVHETITCTAIYTPTGAELPGTYTETATFSGDSNYSGSSSPETNNFTINTATTTTAVTSSLNPSSYGQSVTFTATVEGENGNVKGKKPAKKVKPLQVSGGSVTWNISCSSSTPLNTATGQATCTTALLPVNQVAPYNVVTATYTPDGNHQGSSGSFDQEVTSGVATTIAVTSVSPAAEDYGSTVPVTISATLSWTGGGAAPTASDVTIGGTGFSGSFGTTSCGAPSGDTMVCTNTYTGGSDAVGSYTFTAVFSGDSDYGASSSTQTGNFTINPATTTTSVAGSPNPSTYAQSVTFTATIGAENNFVKGRRNMRKPMDVTGSVAWSANTGCSPSTVTWSATNQVATATCTTSAATHLPVGTDVVTATYSGDSNHSGSNGSVNQVVNGGIATTINVTSVSPAAEDFGANTPVTITAVLSWTGHGVAPTASDVTISGNGNGTYGATSCAARVHDTITCTATYTPTNADVAGTYTETAAFSGDGVYSASTSPQTGNFTINSATSSMTVTSSPNPSAYAQQVTFTATISGENGAVKGNKSKKPLDVTGTVTWSANTGCSASTVSGYPGVATCTTSAATHMPAGTNVVTATYSGDSNHGGSSGSVNQIVNQDPTTIDVTVSPSSEDYGANTPVTITAVLSWTGHGAAPTASNVTIGGTGTASSYGPTSCGARSGDTITCTATYTPTNADVAGVYTETATFSGDNNYTGSSSPETNNFTINNATSNTVVTSGTNPSTYGESVTFTATISGENGAVKGKKSKKPLDVTGSVTWSANTGCSTSTVSGYPGTATCTTSTLPVGAADVVQATYSGDANHSGGSGSVNQEVDKASQTITFTTPAPANALYGSNFTVAATASSSLTVAFTASGSCTVVDHGNGSATYTMSDGAGTCSVIADQAGNGNYTAAPQITETVNASPNSQTITFTTNAPANAVFSSNFTVAATASSGLAVAFTSAGACSNSGATYTMISGTGTCSVIANQAGNSKYATAPTVTEYTNATKATQTITCGSLPATEAYGNSFTASCSASSSLPVSYSSSGSCTNNGATYTMNNGTGSCLVSVSQNGNNNYSAAIPINKSVTAEKANQTITVTTPAPPTATYGSSFTVVASASSELAIAYSSGGACTNSGATYTINAKSGTCTVQMSQPGDNDYNAATAVVETTKVKAAVKPVVSFTGMPSTAAYGSVFTVTASSNETGPEASIPVLTNTTPTICSLTGLTTAGTTVTGTLTMLTGTGQCALHANWALNYVYAAASVTKHTTAEKITPTTSFTGAPASEGNGQTFTVTATSDASGSGASVPAITAAGSCTVGSATETGPGTYQATVTMTKATGTCTTTAKWATTNDYVGKILTQHTAATQ